MNNTALALTGSMEVPYGDKLINLSPPWRRVTMIDIVKEKTGQLYDLYCV